MSQTFKELVKFESGYKLDLLQILPGKDEDATDNQFFLVRA